MKNKTLRYTSLSVLTLLAALTLVACGGKTDKNTSSSNQKETTSKVTTESASKTEAGQKEEQKSETNSATEATTTQAEQKEDKQKSQEAYAKFVGTWENYAGTTAPERSQSSAAGIVTIQSANGTFKYEMGQVEEKDGYYLTGIHLVGGGQGARLIFTPAGVQNEVTGTDGSQDVLSIGQSVSDKDNQFYRN